MSALRKGAASFLSVWRTVAVCVWALFHRQNHVKNTTSGKNNTKSKSLIRRIKQRSVGLFLTDSRLSQAGGVNWASVWAAVCLTGSWDKQSGAHLVLHMKVWGFESKSKIKQESVWEWFVLFLSQMLGVSVHPCSACCALCNRRIWQYKSSLHVTESLHSLLWRCISLDLQEEHFLNLPQDGAPTEGMSTV